MLHVWYGDRVHCIIRVLRSLQNLAVLCWNFKVPKRGTDLSFVGGCAFVAYTGQTRWKCSGVSFCAVSPLVECSYFLSSVSCCVLDLSDSLTINYAGHTLQSAKSSLQM